MTAEIINSLIEPCNCSVGFSHLEDYCITLYMDVSNLTNNFKTSGKCCVVDQHIEFRRYDENSKVLEHLHRPIVLNINANVIVICTCNCITNLSYQPSLYCPDRNMSGWQFRPYNFQ